MRVPIRKARVTKPLFPQADSLHVSAYSVPVTVTCPCLRKASPSLARHLLESFMTLYRARKSDPWQSPSRRSPSENRSLGQHLQVSGATPASKRWLGASSLREMTTRSSY